MRSSRSAASLIIATVLAGSGVAAQAAELATLFTTPEERRLINSNRYRTDEVVNQAPVQQTEVVAPVQQLLREEVTREYRISGITVSPDGAHKVWINSALYDDGAELDDRSRIKVIVGDNVRVRITLPDGRHMYATSGENLQVTYLAPIEN